MSANFNWTTDEDDWEDKVEPPVRPQRSGGRGFSWLYVITVVILAAIVVYWQVSQRVDDATAGVEADLSASFDVVQRALTLEDLELFRSILSGRDPAWTRAQRDLFSDGLLFDRPALGLHWQGVSRPVDVILADDLNAAELVTTHEYITGDDRGISMTVKLELTQTFRTGSNRWLLAPPLTEFWGDWQTFAYDHVQIVAPARDADLVQRLGVDLDEVLANLCQQVPELDCQSAPALNLRFSKSPEALLAIQSPANHFSADKAEMALPAPTLVGQPLDEASYQALLRGYARHVALVALSRWAGYNCCEHGLFLEALTDYLLANQGFTALWPINAELNDLMLESFLPLQDGSIAWQVDLSPARAEAQRLSAYAAIDFLIESDIGARPGRLLQTLMIDQPFDEWLLGTFLDRQMVSRDQLAQSWYLYLFNNSSARERTAPIDFPDQDVLLICVSDSEGTSLFLFQPETATVTSLDGIGDNAFAYPMPLNQGLVLHSLFVAEERYEYWLIWPDGSRTAVLPPPGMSDEMFYLNQANPAGDQLVWTHNPFDSSPEGFSLLDLDACRGQASCTPVPIDGLPIWSPSGQYTLVTERGPSTNAIWLGDADGNRLEFVTNQAFGPFWVDDARFGYLDVSGIVLLERIDDLGDFIFVSRLDQEALFADLPAIRPGSMQALSVLANRADAGSLLVRADASPGNQNVLVRYELATGEKEIIYQHSEEWYSYGLSESGGYLTISQPNTISSSSYSYSSQTTAVVDLTDFSVDVYPNSDFVFAGANWSTNDEWLVLLLDNQIQFAAPAYDYRTIQATEINGTCYAAFWVAQIRQP